MKKKNELPAMIRVKRKNGDITLVAQLPEGYGDKNAVIELREHSWKAHYTVRLGNSTCGYHEYHVYLKIAEPTNQQLHLLVDMVRWHHEHSGIKIRGLYESAEVFGVNHSYRLPIPLIRGLSKQTFFVLTDFNPVREAA